MVAQVRVCIWTSIGRGGYYVLFYLGRPYVCWISCTIPMSVAQDLQLDVVHTVALKVFMLFRDIRITRQSCAYTGAEGRSLQLIQL